MVCVRIVRMARRMLPPNGPRGHIFEPHTRPLDMVCGRIPRRQYCILEDVASRGRYRKNGMSDETTTEMTTETATRNPLMYTCTA